MSHIQNLKSIYEFFLFMDQNLTDAQVLFTYSHQVKHCLSYTDTVLIILNLYHIIISFVLLKSSLSASVVLLLKFITISMRFVSVYISYVP